MIAYFVYNLNKYSGASQQALLLALSLDRPVLVFNHEARGKFRKKRVGDKVEVVDLPSSKFFSLFCLIFFLIYRKVTVLHLHGFFKHGILLGCALKKRLVLKTTLMGSDDFETLLSRTRFKRFTRFLIGRLDVNICLTSNLKLRNVSYIDSEKIRVIPNGVQIPTKYKVVKDNLFCYVGLVCERKRTYESIQYYLENYSDLPNSRMYVIGPLEGIEESDMSYVEKCRSMVSSALNGRNVIFTGNVAKEEVSSYLDRSKGLIFFSKSEGLPNVVLEAMAHNCAPITTGLDGVVKEILGDALDMILTCKTVHESINVDVINEVIFKESLLRRVTSCFSIDRIATSYKALYADLEAR